MSIKQLFTIQPTNEIIEKIIHCFGLTGLDDDNEFSQLDMASQNTLNKFENIKDEIASYYLPCKKDIYMKDLNFKSVITISRQFLKTINYTIDSREKFIKSKKYLMYKIITQNEKISRTKNKIVVSFN